MRWRRMNRARRHRMEAIRMAASAGLFVASTMTDGLRAVCQFEKINGVTVDPRCFHHQMLITNTGWHFALQRRLQRLAHPQTSSKGEV